MNNTNHNYLKTFEEKAEISRRGKLQQVLSSPMLTLQYFIYTRLPFLTHKAIPARAKLFFGSEIRGYFPDSVFSYLYLYGFLEEDLTQVVLQNVKKGMTVIDVGAHIGYFSALAAFLVGKSGSVHAFEATPRTYKILEKNMTQFPNVKTNLNAVWSEKKDLVFYDYGSFYAQCNSFTKAKLTQETLDKIKPEKLIVGTVTIDDYCRMKKLRPHFIKIDAESAEYQILQGMKQTLKKYKPIVTLEVGDNNKKEKEGSKECILFLKKFGYVPFNNINGKMVEHELKPNYYQIFDNIIFSPSTHK
jgi:FkbM family methyltransferase